MQISDCTLVRGKETYQVGRCPNYNNYKCCELDYAALRDISVGSGHSGYILDGSTAPSDLQR